MQPQAGFSSQELSPLEGRGNRIYIHLKNLRLGEPQTPGHTQWAPSSASPRAAAGTTTPSQSLWWAGQQEWEVLTLLRWRI